MPSFLCRSTTIKLSIADLEKSTTTTLITQAGQAQTAHLQTIANEFKKGLNEKPLKETPIYTEEEWPSQLRFLGSHQDMPFLLVKASTGLTTDSSYNRASSSPSSMSVPELTEDNTSFGTTELASTLTSFVTVNDIGLEDEISLVTPTIDTSDDAVTRSSPTPTVYVSCDGSMNSVGTDKVNNGAPVLDPTKVHDHQIKAVEALRSSLLRNRRPHAQQESKPQALCLTVQLSKRSFLPNPYRGVKKIPVFDVKIDIYFNGELCASAYVPERHRSESGIAELTQRFGGRRIDRLLERPWTIVPSGQNADGSLREHKSSQGGYVGAQQRWSAISELLKAEAEKGGRNKWGDLSVLGDYLQNLSKLEMPKEVEELQKPGGANYGIIDVVLTTGCGKKDDPDVGYLSKPTRIRTSDLRASIPKIPNHQPPAVSKDLPVASFKAKVAHRPKTFADAEIIASGVLTPLTPRQSTQPAQSAETLSTSQQHSVVTTPGPALLSNRQLFVAPKAPSTALSAARRRQRRPIQTLRLSQPVTCTLNSSSYLTSSHTSGLALPRNHSPAASPQAFGGSDNTSPVVTENPDLKRKQSGVFAVPYSEFFLPQTPKSNTRAKRQHFTVPFHGRERSHQGYFVKSPSAPTADSTPDRPQHIPQKRYKGTDSTSENNADEAREHDKDKGKNKKRSRMGYIEVMTNKLTVAEEIAVITEEASTGLSVTQNTGDGTTPTSLSIAPRTLRRRSVDLTVAPPSTPKPLSDLCSRRQVTQTAPASGQTRPILTLRIPPPFLATLASRPHTPPRQISTHSATSLSPLTSLGVMTPSSGSSPGVSTPDSPEIPCNETPYSDGPAARAKAKAKTRVKWKPKPVETPQPEWQPGPLNEDCVATYSGDLVRQVRAERTGWFKECGVLVGVRFLVG